MKTKLLIIFILTGFSLGAQNRYEILYLKGEYSKIEILSNHFGDANDYYWNAMALDKNGKILKAIDVLQIGLEKYPNNELLEKLFIDLLYGTGQYSRVKPLLSKYLDYSEYFLKYIKVLEFEENYQDAIKKLKDKLQNDSLNIRYLSLLGDYYLQTDSIEASIKIFDRLIKINPNDQISMYKLAKLYIKKKAYVDAIDLANRVLLNDTENKKFLKIKGIAGFNINDFNMSAICFQLLLNQGDSSKFILKNLGVSQYKEDHFKEAQKKLYLAFKCDSSDYEVNIFLGNALANSNKPNDGLYYLNRADSLIQTNPIILSLFIITNRKFTTNLVNTTKPSYIIKKHINTIRDRNIFFTSLPFIKINSQINKRHWIIMKNLYPNFQVSQNRNCKVMKPLYH